MVDRERDRYLALLVVGLSLTTVGMVVGETFPTPAQYGLLIGAFVLICVAAVNLTKLDPQP